MPLQPTTRLEFYAATNGRDKQAIDIISYIGGKTVVWGSLPAEFFSQHGCVVGSELDCVPLLLVLEVVK